jgi:hypothetical protein
MRRGMLMITRYRTALGLCLALCTACREKPVPVEAPREEEEPASPDRLAEGERLPESETAFGLPLPRGMHVVRQYDDSAYFQGGTDVEKTLAHLRDHVSPATAQLTHEGAEFPRVRIVGGDAERLYRVSVNKAGLGSQVHIQDITPARALTGVSEAEMWRKAGRNPDGTLIDPNQVY